MDKFRIFKTKQFKHNSTNVLSEKSTTKMYLSAGQLGPKTIFLVVLGSLFFIEIFAKEKEKVSYCETEFKDSISEQNEQCELCVKRFQ